MSTTTPVTADQLLKMPDDGYRYELVAGELRKMSPAGWKHGVIGDNVHFHISQFVRTNRLGRVFVAETGFLIAQDPDTVRAPDLAFIRSTNLPTVNPEDAFWPRAPDLAVEVVSPGDTPSEVNEKAEDWLRAGATAVWIVNPATRSVVVRSQNGTVQTLSEHDEIDGAELLPGFHLKCALLFEI